MIQDGLPAMAADDDLRREVERLRERLREAEATLDAIRQGEVDALLVEGPRGPRVYTLTSADETYRLLVEQSREGAATVSADGLVLYCNRRFAEMVGLPPERVVASPIGAYAAAAADRAALAAVLADGGGRELELRAADGTPVPVYLSAAALTVEGTTVHGLVVTDLARQATRARLASIVETSDDAIVSQTLERVITSWNAGAEKLLGYTAAEVIGRSAALFEPPEVAGEGEAVVGRLMETGAAQRFETVRLRKDGGRVDVAMTVSPIRDAAGGGIAALSIVARDITERRRAEAALRAAHARTVEILESISDGFFGLDRGWRFTYVNAAAARLLNRAPEELVGRLAWEACPEALRAVLRERLQRAVERREPAGFEVHAPVVAASPSWYEFRVYPTPDGGGLSVFFADITERKRAEEKLRLLAAELDHRVKNTLASVQSLLVRSRRPDDTVERFVERLEGRLCAKARAHGLLTRSRWEGAGLRELIAEVLEPYGGGGEGRSASVAVDGVDIVLRPTAALSLSLVFHELATNAAKYGALSRPSGRVAVAWEVDGEPAADAGGTDGPRLRLRWVESGGPPVAPPASRGFGTTVVERSVAYELDGDARLEFRPEGVRWLLSVPLAAVGRTKAPATPEPAAPSVAAVPPRTGAEDAPPAAVDRDDHGGGGGMARRILVVEDAMLVALEIDTALGALGWEVIGPVGRLDRALALARTAERLDGAILDVNLDGEEVFPLADELTRRGVPVIFSTGYNGPSVLPARYRDRPRLEKPFGAEQLKRLAADTFG